MELTDNLCKQWLNNKSFNPLTGKKIVESGKVFQMLEKQCTDISLCVNSKYLQRTKDNLITTKSDINQDIAMHIDVSLSSIDKPLKVERHLNKMNITPLISYYQTETSQIFRKLSLLNCHNGQKKLTMSLLEFMTISLKKLKKQETDVLLVYAGASGLACGILSRFFPSLEMLLYDPDENVVKYMPKDIDIQVIKNNKTNYKEGKLITIFTDKEGYFNDETTVFCNNLAKQSQKSILFVSDVRSSDTRQLTIMNDMKNQMKWTIQIQAAMYMHKFTIPFLSPKLKEFLMSQYNNMSFIENIKGTVKFPNIVPNENSIPYLSGDLYIQLYGPQRTAELRLIGNPVARKYNVTRFDVEEIENKMSLFNSIYRSNTVFQYNSIRGTYEQVAEYMVIYNLISLIRKIKPSKEEVYSSISTIDRQIHDVMNKKMNIDDCRISTAKKQKDFSSLAPDLDRCLSNKLSSDRHSLNFLK